MTAAQSWILAGLLVSTWAAAQLWFAQIVVYPLFAKVGEAQYAAYQRFYARRIPLPVIVPGFACFIIPMPLARCGPGGFLATGNLACGIVGLLVTVAVEIPRHAFLERHGRDARVIAELVRYNWPGTLAVTAQPACCLADRRSNVTGETMMILLPVTQAMKASFTHSGAFECAGPPLPAEWPQFPF